MTGNRCSHREGRDLDSKNGLPHLYPDSLPFNNDRLHLEIDSCRNTDNKTQNFKCTVSGRYFKKQPADANNDLKVGRFANELTDRRYVRSVEFVVGKSTQNASLPYSRISNK